MAVLQFSEKLWPFLIEHGYLLVDLYKPLGTDSVEKANAIIHRLFERLPEKEIFDQNNHEVCYYNAMVASKNEFHIGFAVKRTARGKDILHQFLEWAREEGFQVETAKASRINKLSKL